MSLIIYQSSDRIAYITLNRPDKRNALNHEMVDLLKKALTRANQDTTVKAVVIKAEGKVFSAGADLQYLQQLQNNSYEDNLADSKNLKGLFQQIYTHDKVVIAQVQGHAIAGGCGLATVCDFVITHPGVRFGYSEVHIGFVPAIVMVYLIRRIGEGRARELLLSGHLIEAGQALEWGLVNRMVPADSLEQQVTDFALKLVDENSGQSMKRIKTMIAAVQEMGLEAALAFAVEQNAQARGTDDCRQGISAFLNKQPNKW
jgi:methylglutaconyl-CoA hydratase